MSAAVFATSNVRDRGFCEGPGIGVFKSNNPSASSASSWRSPSRELPCSPASSWTERWSRSPGGAIRGLLVCGVDGRDGGCWSSATLLAVHITSSHSSSDSSSDSSNAQSRKFGSDFPVHPGASELSLCKGA